MPAIIVVGLQWGDEGKGKMIDILSQQAEFIVRSQGGHNAGHTLLTQGQEFKFHLIPSGILHAHTRCVIAGGTVIQPKALLEEINELQKRGVSVKDRLFISPSAHVIFPYHVLLDALLESLRGKEAIGTTQRGIGPCYTDASSRQGIRIAELIRPSALRRKLQTTLPHVNATLASFNKAPFSLEEIVAEYSGYGTKLSSFVAPAEEMIYDAIKQSRPVLFEGAHGTYLDITFGSYPFVTSSHTLAAGVACGAGVGPTRIDHTLGVLKAYTTRVGRGPLPTTLTSKEHALFLPPERAREVGTTTGRERRLGWFDAVLARHALGLSGVDSIALMKLDILDSLDSVKICTAYRLNKEKISLPPQTEEAWEEIEPVYEELPGWKKATSSIKKLKDLPKEARAYLDRIEELLKIPFSFVSLGPDREQTLVLHNPFCPHALSAS